MSRPIDHFKQEFIYQRHTYGIIGGRQGYSSQLRDEALVDYDGRNISKLKVVFDLTVPLYTVALGAVNNAGVRFYGAVYNGTVDSCTLA